jgi:hypothetical protein
VTSSTFNESVQIIASFLFVIEFILGAYVLVLNFWHPANRHVSAFLLITAATTIGMGVLASALDLQQASTATILLASIIPVEEPLIFLTVVVLLKPVAKSGIPVWIQPVIQGGM